MSRIFSSTSLHQVNAGNVTDLVTAKPASVAVQDMAPFTVNKGGEAAAETVSDDAFGFFEDLFR